MKPTIFTGSMGIGLLMVAGCSAAEAKRPSLQITLKEIEPIASCIFESPSDEQITECADIESLSEANGPAYARDLDDFKSGLIRSMLGMRTMGMAEGISPSAYASAISYAKCIEEAAYSHPEIAKKTKESQMRALAETERQCQDEPSSTTQLIGLAPSPDDLAAIKPAIISEWTLSRLFGSQSFDYVQEANGWITDEMRPCVRYAYKRPSSPGCAFSNGSLPHAPPPPPRPTSQ